MGKIIHNNYNFDLEKIIFHLNGIFSSDEKMDYLTNILKDIDRIIQVGSTANLIKENTEDYIAENYEGEIKGDVKGLGKVRVILELELDKLKQNENLVKDNTGYFDNLNKIYIKSGMTDIVRIFEAMKKAGIISSGKTDAVQIARIFFNDPLEWKKFQANYNAIKSEIKNTERNSNSGELAEFIKELIEKSFAKKDSVLEDFIKHIEQLQKNII